MWFSLVAILGAQVDENQNGASDWWEFQMDASSLPLAADTDNDGMSNLEEAVAGTDPRNPASRLHLQLASIGVGGDIARLTFHSFPGKRYTLQYNTPNDFTYRPLLRPFLGTGGRLTTWVSSDPATAGGVTADFWLQRPPDVLVPGALATTATPPDLRLGLNRVSLADVNFEAAAVRIQGNYLHLIGTGSHRFGLSCDGPAEWQMNLNSDDLMGLGPLINHDGIALLESSSVQLTQRQIRPFQLLYLPANRAHPVVDVTIREDSAVEPIPLDRNLLLWLGDSSVAQAAASEACASFRVTVANPDADGDGVTDHEELALGLNPMDRKTFGNRDMDDAIAIIANGGPVNSDFVAPMPLAPDAGAPNPDERDAFRFLEQATFGPSEIHMEAVQRLGINAWLDRQMNPAWAPRQSFQAYCRAADAYDDRNSTKPFNENRVTHRRNLRSAWFNGAIYGKDALRQRVGFALSRIFTTSTQDNFISYRTYGMASYEDMLAENAFGNFRELLEDVTRHPIMGMYLSHLKNQKENLAAGTKPDENFAREIMQLFSIGLFELHPDGSLRRDPLGRPIPTYDNHDITELARVFTGLSFSWHYNTADNVNPDFNFWGGPLSDQYAYVHPMKMFDGPLGAHDHGAKTIVGGVYLPAETPGDQDIAAALDALHNHPNTPPFIATLLIKSLVTSNPSRGYVYRVAEAFRDNGFGDRGDMKAVLKAIFLDQEARHPDFYEAEHYGKLREPVLVFTAACRAFPPTNNLPLTAISVAGYGGINTNATHGDVYRMPFHEQTLEFNFGQTPMHAPSVFGWFRPQFSPVGVLAAAQLTGPEFQLRTDPLIVANINAMRHLIFRPVGFNLGTVANQHPFNDDLKFDASTVPLEAFDVPTLVDELNRRLCGGGLSPSLQAVLLEGLGEETNPRDRVRSGIHLILNSPEYMAQR